MPQTKDDFLPIVTYSTCAVSKTNMNNRRSGKALEHINYVGPEYEDQESKRKLERLKISPTRSQNILWIWYWLIQVVHNSRRGFLLNNLLNIQTEINGPIFQEACSQAWLTGVWPGLPKLQRRFPWGLCEETGTRQHVVSTKYKSSACLVWTGLYFGPEISTFFDKSLQNSHT